MNKNEFRKILQKLHLDTQQGFRSSVLFELNKINRSQIDIEQATAFSELAYRNNDFYLALKFLYRFFRSEKDYDSKLIIESNSLSAYAAALAGIGANNEAKIIFKTLNADVNSLLNYAFLLFSEWDYENSIPLITKFIKSQKDEYKILVGRLNLVAAHIANGDLNEGELLLNDLQNDLFKNPNAFILTGNSFEIKSQIHLLNRQYKEARLSLTYATKYLDQGGSRYKLYVEKWKAVLDLEMNPKSESNLSKLNSIRCQALDLKNWETVRDCDFHLARILNNEELLQRILIGTPYSGYKKRIKKIYGIIEDPKIPLIYKPGFQNESSYLEKIDLDFSNIPRLLVQRPTSYKLLQILCRDIYKPPRMGTVFHSLYPKEYFNPFSSPARVRNSIKRFNNSMRSLSLDFKIKINSSHIQLHSESRNNIRFTQVSLQNSFFKIKDQFQHRHFNAKSISKLLNVSKPTALKLILWGIDKSIIKKYGSGPNIYYRFKKK